MDMRPMTFLVRLSRDAHGALRGVVERVSTGEKAAFADLREVVAILERIARHELQA